MCVCVRVAIPQTETTSVGQVTAYLDDGGIQYIR